LVAGFGGADGDRTRDLVNAIHARSQLRYSPTGETVIVSSPRCGVNRGNRYGPRPCLSRMPSISLIALLRYSSGGSLERYVSSTATAPRGSAGSFPAASDSAAINVSVASASAACPGSGGGLQLACHCENRWSRTA